MKNKTHHRRSARSVCVSRVLSYMYRERSVPLPLMLTASADVLWFSEGRQQCKVQTCYAFQKAANRVCKCVHQNGRRRSITENRSAASHALRTCSETCSRRPGSWLVERLCVNRATSTRSDESGIAGAGYICFETRVLVARLNESSVWNTALF